MRWMVHFCIGFLSQKLANAKHIMLSGIVMMENPLARPEFGLSLPNRFPYSVCLLLVWHLIFDLRTPRFIICPHLHLSLACLATHFLSHLVHLVAVSWIYILFSILSFLYLKTKKNWTPWSESASELYPPSDRLLTKLVPTFEDRWSHVVSVTDPYGRILAFLDRSRYFFFQVPS
jgi:hypothetical protein